MANGKCVRVVASIVHITKGGNHTIISVFRKLTADMSGIRRNQIYRFEDVPLV